MVVMLELIVEGDEGLYVFFVVDYLDDDIKVCMWDL